MEELVYSCKLMRKNASNWVGVLAVIPIVCFVVIIVNFMAGEDKLPEALQGTTIYFALACMLSSIGIAIMYYKSQLQMNIYKTGNKITVEIEDSKAIDPILVESPFTMSKQWYHRETGQRGVKMKELCLTFIDKNGDCSLTIISVLGAIHDAPYEWEYLDLFNTEDMARLKKSSNVYTNGKAEEISLEINSLLALQLK